MQVDSIDPPVFFIIYFIYAERLHSYWLPLHHV